MLEKANLNSTWVRRTMIVQQPLARVEQP
uniref:Uncharacterized protein n=1 Tax=Arundo donax TaxID=35708 RepID=A0A0A9C9A6_ARUDO